MATDARVLDALSYMVFAAGFDDLVFSNAVNQ